MQTKLTLRLDDSLIEQAKLYAKEHGKSLSLVVANYFQTLTSQNVAAPSSPITQSLIGIIDPKLVNGDDYKKHLDQKYMDNSNF